jgi:hypothetical protein
MLSAGPTLCATGDPTRYATLGLLGGKLTLLAAAYVCLVGILHPQRPTAAGAETWLSLVRSSIGQTSVLVFAVHSFLLVL